MRPVIYKANVQTTAFMHAGKFMDKNLAIANRSQYTEGIYRPKYYTDTLKSRLRVIQVTKNETIG